MRKSINKFLCTTLVGILCLSLIGCDANKNETSSKASKEIIVGASPVPHSEILKAAEPILEKEGYKLKIVEFTDYIMPNNALNEKSLDANFFQHVPFLETTNKEKGYNLDYTVKVHLEPLGIYSKKVKNLNDVKDGFKVAIPNDPTNCSRALKLLASNNFIKLKDTDSATVKDIIANPKNLKIEEIEAPQLPRSLEDVHIAVINTNYALTANLNPTDDALALEDKNSPYANILAVRKEDKDSEKIKALSKALTSEEIRKFIEDKYKGSIIPSF